MATLQKTSSMFLFFTLLGGLSGGVLGEILRRVSPPGLIYDIFLKGHKVGLTSPLNVDLHVLTFTFGLTIEINLLIALGLILGIYTYKQA